MLFRSGSFRSKLFLVYKATRQHARNLGLFALVYKSCMLLLKHTSPTGKERHYDAFLAGLVGGYTVFGRTIHNSVSQQIVIYVAARVCLALAKLAVQQRHAAGKEGGGGFELFGNGELRRSMARNGWPVFASLSWAMVMYIFRWHPESVQSSLRSSMSYMWVFCMLGTWMKANDMTVMFSRTIGIRYERWFGTTNECARLACPVTMHHWSCFIASICFVCTMQCCKSKHRAHKSYETIRNVDTIHVQSIMRDLHLLRGGVLSYRWWFAATMHAPLFRCPPLAATNQRRLESSASDLHLLANPFNFEFRPLLYSHCRHDPPLPP
jgi:peroxisomal membrane protein 4